MVELSLNFDKPTGTVKMTKAAAERINELVEMEGREGQAIQIKVVPGGCAGFSYEFGWAAANSPGNKVELDGAVLLVSDSDMRLLAGSTLDYVKSLAGAKFEINNQNATSSCGCGKSFA
jgi:iron-sulfur cluster insertion protein